MTKTKDQRPSTPDPNTTIQQNQYGVLKSWTSFSKNEPIQMSDG